MLKLINFIFHYSFSKLKAYIGFGVPPDHLITAGKLPIYYFISLKFNIQISTNKTRSNECARFVGHSQDSISRNEKDTRRLERHRQHKSKVLHSTVEF